MLPARLPCSLHIPPLFGVLVGAVLLSRTGDRNFIEFAPWLVLIATIIIVLRSILLRRWGLISGYIGGVISHRANRTLVRSIVIAIGIAASAYFFWKLYGPAVTHIGVE